MRRLDEIFDLRYGHSLELNALKKVEAPAGVNFVSRAMKNNGVTARVLVEDVPASAGEISVALGGNGVLSSFVQPEPFVCGRDVMVLTAKSPTMTLEEKLWYCRCIWENRPRYSYGRQANRTLGSLLMPEKMPLWAEDLRVPSYHWPVPSDLGPVMGSYSLSHLDLVPITDLFNIEPGHALSLNKLEQVEEPAGVNFVSRTAKNNGISGRISLPKGVDPAPAGTLSVALSAAPLTTFYQSEPYVTGYHVAVLSPKIEMSVGEMLWWKTAIEANKYRYSFGRQANRTLATILVPGAPPSYVSQLLTPPSFV